MKDKDKKRKVCHEKKIVFITNTLGSLVAAAYFVSSDSIIGMLLGIYFMYSMFCFLITSEEYIGRK